MSFYGGRPGNPFILVTSFESISDMVSNFRLGPDYTAVHYDEYVIINTDNKNDPDNGKIYKRGYNYSNLLGGAEYIGTIVGPAGKAPMLEMTTVEDVEDIAESEPYGRYTHGSYELSDDSLVPGKDGNTYNDEISWACVSVRDANEADCTAYIGFTFPYLITEFTSRGVDPYVSGSYADTSAVTRIDDGTHPFYEQWRLDIPKGVHGESVQNVRVIADMSNPVDPITGESVTVESYDGMADDVNNGYSILVYDYYDYDTYEDGDMKTMYLGDYRMMTYWEVNAAGTITVHYTHGSPDTWVNRIKWISSVTQNDTGHEGELGINWNTGEATTYVDLNYPTSLSVNTSGNQKLHVVWADGTEGDIGNPLNYIESMEIDSNNHLKVTYSDTTKGTSGVVDLGLITVNYEYTVGDVISSISWSGTGILVDSGSGNISVKFTISPARFINPEATGATVGLGSCYWSSFDGTITGNLLFQADPTKVTVVNSLAGLEITINAGSSSGTAVTTNVAISLTQFSFQLTGVSS